MPIIAIVVIVLFFILVAASGIRTVPQGQVWIIERFGAYRRQLAPALTLRCRSPNGWGAG